MKWFWGFLRKYRFKLLGGLILAGLEFMKTRLEKQ